MDIYTLIFAIWPGLQGCMGTTLLALMWPCRACSNSTGPKTSTALLAFTWVVRKKVPVYGLLRRRRSGEPVKPGMAIYHQIWFSPIR